MYAPTGITVVRTSMYLGGGGEVYEVEVDVVQVQFAQRLPEGRHHRLLGVLVVP